MFQSANDRVFDSDTMFLPKTTGQQYWWFQSANDRVFDSDMWFGSTPGDAVRVSIR